MSSRANLENGSVWVGIASESDVASACRQARNLAEALGFSKLASYYIATATSELSSNVLRHGGGGSFAARACRCRPGIELEALDDGPGIADVELALSEGYSTAGSLGCGLPGVQRLMDELAIENLPGAGVRVQARKWL